MSSSDCLTLLVELLDTETLDTKVQGKLYILFDSNNNQFIIRGCNDLDLSNYYPYSFLVDEHNKKDLVDFIDLFSNEDQIRLTIYNFNDLPLTSEEITFEYLEEYASEEYEFLSYRPQFFSKSSMKKILSVISSLRNYY